MSASGISSACPWLFEITAAIIIVHCDMLLPVVWPLATVLVPFDADFVVVVEPPGPVVDP